MDLSAPASRRLQTAGVAIAGAAQTHEVDERSVHGRDGLL